MMLNDEYKGLDISDLNLSKFKEKALQMKDEGELEFTENNQLNVEKFFQEFDHFCSILQNSNGDATEFHYVFNSILDLGNIYQSENVIPCMIQSKMFFNILYCVDINAPLIYSILINMVSCSFENLLLLFKNNLMNTLIYGILSEDHDICIKSFHCFSIMLACHENMEHCIILRSLIASANIIRVMYDRSMGNDFDEKAIYSFIYFFDLFFEHIPPDSIRTSDNHAAYMESFDKFLYECEEKQSFDKDQFECFLFNGISLSQDSIYYNIILRSLNFAANSRNVKIISNFCWIMFYLLRRDISTYTTIFLDLKFLAHTSQWMKLPNPKAIYEVLSLIIAQLFHESSSFVHLPQEDIEQLTSIAIMIFDYTSIINNPQEGNEQSPLSIIDNEDFEKKAIGALGNSILFNEQSFPSDILNDERRNKIIQKASQSSFRLSRYYCYLALAIASVIDDVFLILNSDVIERIFEFLDKKEGNFVESSLYSFSQIFSKQQQMGNDVFKNLFLDLGGEDLLLDLMNSNNKNISKAAELIYDQYIIIKPEEEFDQ